MVRAVVDADAGAAGAAVRGVCAAAWVMVLVCGCARVEYLGADGKTVERRATAYYPYEYRAATGDMVLSEYAVKTMVDGAVELGPEAVGRVLEHAERRAKETERREP